MRNLRNLVIVIFAALMITSCKKELAVELPIDVVTDSVTQVDWSTANVYSEVKNDGESVVSFRGVVWDIKPNPTLELNTKTDDGRGLGSYQSKIQGLTEGTQYFVRSYAVNSNDTTYGNELTFKTSSWTPKEIKNVFDWWNSENGIIKEGDYVEYWLGTNGTKLEHGSDKTKGLFVKSDKDWGNKPSLLLNPNFKSEDCGYYAKTSSLKSSKTVIMVSKVYDIHNTNNIMINFGHASIGMWGQSNGSYFLRHYGYLETYSGNSFLKNSYQFIRFSYNRTNGGTDYFADTKVSFRSRIYTNNSRPNIDYVNRKFGIGYFEPNHGKTPKMSVVEVLVLDGIPDEKELDTYEKYLKYKYKF